MLVDYGLGFTNKFHTDENKEYIPSNSHFVKTCCIKVETLNFNGFSAK